MNQTRLIIAICCIATLFCLACAPDLVVNNVRHDSFLTTQRIVKGTVKNQGFQPAPESTTVVKHRYSPSDPYTEAARVSTPALPRWESIELPLLPFHPSAFPDNANCIYLEVCADTDDVVEESSEANNCTNATFCFD